MSSNTLKTRIRSKIDYLANWNNNTTFIPLLGEICIAIIPRNTSATREADIGVGVDTNTIGVKGQESGPRATIGLTPYAIGIKVGDGANNFSTLPWIQAVAGDVYAWAKNATPPTANEISVTYGNNLNIDTVQEAIDEIRGSLGNIVAGNVDPNTLSSALEALQAQLAGGGEQTLFTSNTYSTPEQEGDDPVRQYPTKIIRNIIKNGLSFTVQGDNLVEADLPDIHINKISDFATTGNYNSSTNPLATKNYIDSEISTMRTQITGAMSFLGIVYESDLPQNTKIEDGTTNVTPIIRIDANTTNTISIANLRAGDVILYREIVTTTTIDPETNTEITVNTDAPIGKEFIWTGGAWELLGDEGSYVIKGAITKADFTSALRTEFDNKISNSEAASTYVAKHDDDSLMTAAEHTKLAGIEAGADVNTIESISINSGSALTPDANKKVNIEIPTISINGTEQTPSNHNIDIEVPIIKNGSNNVNLAQDHSVTFAPIAFTGKMDDIDANGSSVTILYCGDAGTDLFQTT